MDLGLFFGWVQGGGKVGLRLLFGGLGIGFRGGSGLVDAGFRVGLRRV